MNKELSKRLREVFLNGKWIANTNFKDQLTSISWKQAIQKVGNLNTIAALTFHVNYYLKGLLDAFEYGKLDISDKYSFDFEPINSSEDWEKLIANFLANAEKFANRVELMDISDLEQTFIDEKYGTVLRNIEATIEHSYYHLGQISMLKKMIEN